MLGFTDFLTTLSEYSHALFTSELSTHLGKIRQGHRGTEPHAGGHAALQRWRDHTLQNLLTGGAATEPPGQPAALPKTKLHSEPDISPDYPTHCLRDQCLRTSRFIGERLMVPSDITKTLHTGNSDSCFVRSLFRYNQTSSAAFMAVSFQEPARVPRLIHQAMVGWESMCAATAAELKTIELTAV